MTNRPTRTCRDCAAPFAASANDYTVRCMDCRAARRDRPSKAAAADMAASYYAAANKARAAARAAYAANDMAAYHAHAADFQAAMAAAKAVQA